MSSQVFVGVYFKVGHTTNASTELSVVGVGCPYLVLREDARIGTTDAEECDNYAAFWFNLQSNVEIMLQCKAG